MPLVCGAQAEVETRTHNRARVHQVCVRVESNVCIVAQSDHQFSQPRNAKQGRNSTYQLLSARPTGAQSLGSTLGPIAWPFA
eukprot:8609741-Alexandrium_andersonii.AAC.1